MISASQRPAVTREAKHARNAASPAGLTEAEGLLFKHISDQPVHIDDLVRSARIDLPAATGLLLSMEIKNLITQLPGKRFKR